MLIAALQADPPINTLVAGVTFDRPKLKALGRVEAKIDGISLARCVVFPEVHEAFDSYIELRRHSVVKETPASCRLDRDFIHSVVPVELRSKPTGGTWCLTCAEVVHGMRRPRLVAVSKAWMPKYKCDPGLAAVEGGGAEGEEGGGAEDAVDEDGAIAPFSNFVLSLPVAGSFLYCPTCSELVHARFVTRHHCKDSKHRSMSAVNQALRLTLLEAPVTAPALKPTAVTTAGAVVGAVSIFCRGWARRRDRDTSRFDPDVLVFLRRLFDEGNEEDAATKWNPYEALGALNDSIAPKFSLDQLAKPTEDNIKSLFSKWTAEEKKKRTAIPASLAEAASADAGLSLTASLTFPEAPDFQAAPAPKASAKKRYKRTTVPASQVVAEVGWN